MLSNKNFAVLALTVVLAASLLLTGTVFAIGDLANESKSFSYDGVESVVSQLDFEKPPTSQLVLKEKFEQYVTLSEDGKTATLFSEEDAAGLLEMRNNKMRSPLSYDEVLRLIGDTVNLYLEYDEIVIDPEIAEMIGVSDYLINNTGVIKCEHPKENGYNYGKMIRDIYSTIIYRLYLLDSGLTRMYTGDVIIRDDEGNPVDFQFNILYEGDKLLDDYAVAKCLYLLSFDEGETIGDEYNRKLYREYMDFYHKWLNLGWENYVDGEPIDDFSIQNDLLIIDAPLGVDMRYTEEYEIWLAPKSADARNVVFPTAEVKELKPSEYFNRLYSEEFPTRHVDITVGHPGHGNTRPMSDEDKVVILNIIDSDRAWSEGIHVHELQGRFDLDGHGINYCCGHLYDTNGTYLELTQEEIDVIESLLAKYAQYL